MYIPPVYPVVGLGDIGLFDLSVELSDLFVLSDYFVESSMQRFGQNNPISTVECSFVYQMFGEKYVFLSGDDLSIFIIWVKVLRDQYRTDGIKCLEGKCPDYYVRVESEFGEHVPFPPSYDVLNIKT